VPGPVDIRRRLVDVLDRLGFGPETDSEASVRLTCCPLLEAARRQPEVVCGVHLGIVQGALAEWRLPLTGVDLLPFSEPGACRLLLGTDQSAQPIPTA
jgi:predicted ArsR family transcriptional regulator